MFAAGICNMNAFLLTLSTLSPSSDTFLLPSPTFTSALSQTLQLMQQQALVAQSAYLSPVATVAAVQMQQLAALNPSSIIATPIASITPSSGNERQRTLARADLIRFLLEV